MKRFLLSMMLCGAIAATSAQERLLFLTEDGSGIRDGKISVIDIDNTGKYNVIFAGTNRTGSDRVYIVKSNGDGTFSGVDNTIPISGGKWISATWEDLNNDGKIDLFTSGTHGDAGGSYANFLTNNGNGTFTDHWELDLLQGAPGSVAADFDNDGIIDLMIFDFQNSTTPNHGYLYFGKEDGTFEAPVNVLPPAVTIFGDVNITLVDINNDGYLDYYLCGYVHNTEAPGKRRYSALYINNGNRTFTENSLLASGVSSNQATFLFADMDQDGWMDMVMFGHEGSGKMRCFLNIDGEELVEAAIIPGIYQTKTVPQSGVLADFNNDGLYDLVASVYSGNSATPKEQLNFFTGTGENVNFLTFNSAMSTQFLGASNGSVAVLDANNDGILDFAVMGYSSKNASDYGTNNSDFCAIYKNTTYTATNTPPTAPTGLNSSVNNKNVTLTWEAATDDKTPAASLSYNLYLKNTSTGKYYRTPKADLATGRRLVYEHGNMYLSKTITFNNLPNGLYEWTVQAIDAAYAGGQFAATQIFTLGAQTLIDKISESVKIVVNDDEVAVSGGNILNMSIYNIEGKKLAEVTGKNTLSCKNYNSGVYIVKVQTEKGLICKKIVK